MKKIRNILRYIFYCYAAPKMMAEEINNELSDLNC